MKKGTAVLLSVGLVLCGLVITAASVTGVMLRSGVNQLESILTMDWGEASPYSGSTSGNRTLLQYENSGFDSIKISSAFKLTVTEGENWSVQVKVNPNWSDRVVLHQKGSQLNIRLKNGSGWFSNPHAEAEITLPRLTALQASGATNIRLSGLTLPDFDLDVSGASKVTFSNCSATRLRVEASGASKIDFGAGEQLVEELTLDCSGASKIDHSKRAARQVNLDLSGASKLELKVNSGDLSGEVSGASKITIYGTVVSSRINSSGASSIQYKD